MTKTSVWIAIFFPYNDFYFHLSYTSKVQRSKWLETSILYFLFTRQQILVFMYINIIL